MIEMNSFLNMDCMAGMKQFPDGYFDLAITDPPYFPGPNRRGFYGSKVSPIGVQRSYERITTWEVPTIAYFQELKRVSKHQIIWGSNYYDTYLGPGRIVWDKCNTSSGYSDCEIAYCSKHDSVRLFRYMWNGMLQGKSISEGHIQQGNKALNERKIHPTQKPVNLYKWILMNYAKPGDKILDTHVGSASSLVACYEMGFDFIGFELDRKTFLKAKARVKEVMAQIRMEIK